MHEPSLKVANLHRKNCTDAKIVFHTDLYRNVVCYFILKLISKIFCLLFRDIYAKVFNSFANRRIGSTVAYVKTQCNCCTEIIVNCMLSEID